MPNVLVAGAGGLIGIAVCAAFRRQGYRVFGLVRKQEHFPFLLAAEVLPFLGDIEAPDTFSAVLAQCSIVIDASGVNAKLIDYVLEFNEAELVPAYKKLLIVTSGTLNLGGKIDGYVVEDALVCVFRRVTRSKSSVRTFP